MNESSYDPARGCEGSYVRDCKSADWAEDL